MNHNHLPRKIAFAFVALLFAQSVFAKEIIRSIAHGTYELPLVLMAPPGSAQAGELLSCADVPMGEPPQFLLRLSLVFDRFEGVCDDLGPVPCDGRLVGLQESCSGDGDGNSGESASIDAPYNAGALLRLCWDPSGEGNCTAEYEVATGASGASQLQRLTGSPQGRTISVSTIEGTRSFDVDGSKVKIKRRTARTDSLFEASDPAEPAQNCLLPAPLRQRDACGIASIAIRTTDGDEDSADDD